MEETPRIYSASQYEHLGTKLNKVRISERIDAPSLPGDASTRSRYVQEQGRPILGVCCSCNLKLTGKLPGREYSHPKGSNVAKSSRKGSHLR